MSSLEFTQNQEHRYGPRFLYGALALISLCALPAILMAMGVDLSTLGVAPPANHSLPAIEVAFMALRGSLVHTLLEWTAFSAAMGVCCLAFLRYRLTNDRSMLLIGVAFACAGCMDAFHTLAADRLTSAVADNRDLIPFTWAISRLYNALILLAGVCLCLLTEGARDKKKRRVLLIPGACAGFVLVAYTTISYCSNSSSLPNTMFAEAALKRPYDLAALVPFVLGALFVFPIYVRRNKTVFAKLLFLSMIPQVATQLYMLLDSSALFDASFNAAHALKAVAYLVPFAGLIIEHAITHKKALEIAESAEAAGRRNRSIMHAVTDALVVIDERGIIESCNSATSSLFGYSEEELVGHNVSMLVSDPHRDLHDQYLQRFLTTREARIIGKPQEVVGVKKNGEFLSVRLTVDEVECPSGTLFVGMLHDLTQEKRMNSRLSQSEKLESIGQLAAGIAHEINTPAQFANDNVQFLGDAASDLIDLIEFLYEMLREAGGDVVITSSKIEEFKKRLVHADYEFLLEEIPRAIEQSLDGLGSIGNIVRAMKEFSHPGGASKANADLNRTIQSTVTVARNEWKYVAEVELDLDPTLPPVPCIQGDFNQVILNLVVNAAHAIEGHLPEGSTQKGKICISTRAEEDWVEIVVRDTGCGMSPDVADRIFDPFFTTKEVGRGTGQGLAIAHATIVDKHQGTIQVESTPGEGTAFTIRLPLETLSV